MSPENAAQSKKAESEVPESVLCSDPVKSAKSTAKLLNLYAQDMLAYCKDSRLIYGCALSMRKSIELMAAYLLYLQRNHNIPKENHIDTLRLLHDRRFIELRDAVVKEAGNDESFEHQGINYILHYQGYRAKEGFREKERDDLMICHRIYRYCLENSYRTLLNYFLTIATEIRDYADRPGYEDLLSVTEQPAHVQYQQRLEDIEQAYREVYERNNQDQRDDGWLDLHAQYMQNYLPFEKEKPVISNQVVVLIRLITERTMAKFILNHSGSISASDVREGEGKGKSSGGKKQLTDDETISGYAKLLMEFSRDNMAESEISLCKDLAGYATLVGQNSTPLVHWQNGPLSDQNPATLVGKKVDRHNLIMEKLSDECYYVFRDSVEEDHPHFAWEYIQSRSKTRSRELEQENKACKEQIDKLEKKLKEWRDRERRLRIIITIGSILFVGLLIWLGYYIAADRQRRAETEASERIEIRRYADYVFENGMPVGIHDLTEEETRDRYDHYEFTTRGGILTDVSHVRMDGKVIDESIHEERPARMNIQYAGDGSLLYIQMFNADGDGLLALNYSRNLQNVDLLDANTLSSAVYLPFDITRLKLAEVKDTSSQNSQKLFSTIHQYRVVSRDEKGRETQTLFADGDERKSDGNGVTGYACSYDPETGRLTGRVFEYRDTPAADQHLLLEENRFYVGDMLSEKEFRYSDGNQIRYKYYYSAQGLCECIRISGQESTETQWTAVRYTYDDHFNLITRSYENDTGDKVSGPEGYARMEQRFDSENRRVSLQYLNSQGQPTAGPEGFASFFCTYLDDGYETRHWYDAEGVPYIMNGKAVAFLIHRENDSTYHTAFLDANNSLTTESHGAYQIRRICDERGRWTSVSYLDRYGKPFMTDDGYAVLEIDYSKENGLPCERKYLNESNNLTPVGKGYAIQKIEYNARGLPVEYRYYDPEEQPLQSMPEVVRTYDSYGRMIEEKALDTEGHLLDVDGYCRYTVVYGETDGSVTKTCYQADGQLGTMSEGISICRDNYDESGLWISTYYYGRDGQPCINASKGYAGIEVVHDSQGHRIRETFLGEDGKPMMVKGRATRLWKFDEQGRNTEYCILDTEEKPTDAAFGYAYIRYTYDPNGYLASESYLDASGSLTMSGDSNYACTTYERDSSGRILTQTWWGPDQQKTACSKGYASIHKTYDEQGRNTYWETRNTEGLLAKAAGNSYAAVSMKYNEFGMTEITYYDTEGKPTADTDFATLKKEFDSMGRVISYAYYDAEGKLTVLKKRGYAKMRQTYDERSRVSHEAYYGADDRPCIVENMDCAGISWKYDGSGRLLELIFYGTDEQPRISAVYDYAMLRREYDDMGNISRESYFDQDGQPYEYGDGYAAITYLYNKSSQLLSVSFLGADGKLTIPYYYSYARKENEYDENSRCVRTTYYSSETARVWQEDLGYAEVKYQYDSNGNLTEITYFGEDGKLLSGPGPEEGDYDLLKHAKAVFAYDESGRRISESYYLADGTPGTYRNTYHKAALSYDSAGQHITKCTYNEKGDPALSEDFCFRKEWTEDQDGRITWQAAYGADQKPMLAIDDVCSTYAAEKMTYDKNGRLHRKEIFGTDEKPMMTVICFRIDSKGGLQLLAPGSYAEDTDLYHTLQAAKVEFAYDRDGRLTEMRLAGPDNDPVKASDYQPYAETTFDALKSWRIQWSYSNNLIQETCTDAEGNQIVTKIRTDKDVSLLKLQTIEKENKGSSQKQSGQTERIIYEEGKISFIFTDRNGNCVTDEETGYAQMQIEYDQDEYFTSRIKAIRFFDSDGNAVVSKALHRQRLSLNSASEEDLDYATGCAAVEVSIDTMDRTGFYAGYYGTFKEQIKLLRYYGPDGKLMMNRHVGFSCSKMTNDDQTSSLIYLDAEGLPMVSSEAGFAIRRQTRSGETTTTEYLDENGLLMMNPVTGCAYTVTTAARVNGTANTEVRYYDENRQLTVNPVTGCAIIRKTGTDLNTTVTAYYDADDRLMINAVQGCAKKQITERNGTILHAEYFDTEENPMNNPVEGYAVFETDQSGKRYLDAAGNLVFQQDKGYAAEVTETAELYGKTVCTVTWLDANGNPVLNPLEGYAKFECTIYDVTDEDGNPVIPDGLDAAVSEMTVLWDPDGNIVKYQEKILIDRKGHYIYRYYDPEGLPFYMEEHAACSWTEIKSCVWQYCVLGVYYDVEGQVIRYEMISEWGL